MANTAVYSSPGKFRQLRPFLMASVLYGLLGGGLYLWLSGQATHTIDERKAALPRIEVKIASPATAGIGTEENAEAAGGQPVAPDVSTFVVPEGMSRIAIVISDMGLSERNTEKAVLDLPAEVTLSFSAYAQRLPFWLEQGRNARHETLLAIPMEPQTFPKDDPGPKALMARNSVEENMETLREIMDQGQGYVGFSNFQGSRFMADAKKLRPVFQYMKDIGMIFLDTTPDVSTATLETVSQTRVPYLKGDVTLDAVPTDIAIRDNLRKLEGLAARQGYAVGLASAYPVTFNAIAEWLPTLKSKNIALTPLSSVAAYARAQQEKGNQANPQEKEETHEPEPAGSH